MLIYCSNHLQRSLYTRTVDQVTSQPAFNCSMSKVETSIVVIGNFEQILHIALVLPLLTLNKYMPAGKLLCGGNIAL